MAKGSLTSIVQMVSITTTRPTLATAAGRKTVGVINKVLAWPHVPIINWIATEDRRATHAEIDALLPPFGLKILSSPVTIQPLVWINGLELCSKVQP